MAVYTVILQGGPMEQIDDLLRRLGDTTALFNRIADEVVLPALARNYDASGLKSHNGILKNAITKRGARGNVIQVSMRLLRVAVDYGEVPYARWAIEGRKRVRAKRAKALHFFIEGQEFFRKEVGPAPPHRVYYLLDNDLDKVTQIVREFVMPRGVALEGVARK